MKAFKPISFFVLLTLVSLGSNAQRGFVKGYLRDSITHYPILNGTVTNLTSQKQVKTNTKGFFFIEATAGEQLVVQSKEYENDTLKYTTLFIDTITLYLSPSGSILPGVTVRANYTKYQLDSIRRRTDFEIMRGNVAPTVGSHAPDGFGVTLSMDRVWKKKTKKKAQANTLFQKTEEQLYVDYRFSPQMVSYYTGLKSDALRLFMYQNTPSYKWLRQHTDQQDVLFYINDKLKLFKKGTNTKS